MINYITPEMRLAAERYALSDKSDPFALPGPRPIFATASPHSPTPTVAKATTTPKKPPNGAKSSCPMVQLSHGTPRSIAM